MLSYQHGYHAGNFADVFKHLALSRIMAYLCQKDKPLYYLDTHSGCGLYDLKDNQANKTSEYRQGISLLWQQKDRMSPLMSNYLSVIQAFNPNGSLRYYPGSPCLARALLRSQDRMIFSELHPREFEQLKQLPKQGKHIFYNHEDGLKTMIATVPPPERRGLIFTDPSWEVKDDYKNIPRTIQSAYNRFSTGVYCLWYPVIDNRLHQQLIRGMSQIDSTKMLRIEFYLTGTRHEGMNGCGLWLVNPPHTLVAEMTTILNDLRTLFNPGVSFYLIEESPFRSI